MAQVEGKAYLAKSLEDLLASKRGRARQSALRETQKAALGAPEMSISMGVDRLSMAELQIVEPADLPKVLMDQAQHTIRGIFARNSFFTYYEFTKDDDTDLASSAVLLKGLNPLLYQELGVPEDTLRAYFRDRIFYDPDSYPAWEQPSLKPGYVGSLEMLAEDVDRELRIHFPDREKLSQGIKNTQNRFRELYEEADPYSLSIAATLKRVGGSAFAELGLKLHDIHALRSIGGVDRLMTFAYLFPELYQGEKLPDETIEKQKADTLKMWENLQGGSGDSWLYSFLVAVDRLQLMTTFNVNASKKNASQAA